MPFPPCGVSAFRRKEAQAQLDTSLGLAIQQALRAAKYHNVVVIMLGEFEYLLLSASARLGDEAYGAAIRTAIEQAAGRRCSVGALYTTLDRLEAKGLVETWMGDATPQRGGRSKR